VAARDTAGPLIEDPLDRHVCRLSPRGRLLNNPSSDALEAPCEYRLALQATIVGPADGVAFQAASSPLEKGYAHLLNSPCFYDPKEGPDHCPPSLYSGPVAFGLAAGWFVPETGTFRAWALREAGTCRPHYSPPFYTETPGCNFRQEVCSAAQTVTLPATVDVSCSTITHARIHRHQRHRR
jgi:hypothetical protein